MAGGKEGSPQINAQTGGRTGPTESQVAPSKPLASSPPGDLQRHSPPTLTKEPGGMRRRQTRREAGTELEGQRQLAGAF